MFKNGSQILAIAVLTMTASSIRAEERQGPTTYTGPGPVATESGEQVDLSQPSSEQVAGMSGETQEADRQRNHDGVTADDANAFGVAHHDLETFSRALEAAGLADALSDGNYTVFAPTDAAFDALPEGQLDELLKPENQEQLRSILRGHIVSGKVDAAMASTLNSAMVLNGDTLEISVENEKVAIGGANVVQTDIQADQLTIHTIDTVLMPQGEMGHAPRTVSRDSQPSYESDGYKSSEQSIPEEEEAEE